MTSRPARGRPALTEAYRIEDREDRRACVLSNGLTLIVQRYDAAPIVAVRAYLEGGTVFEDCWASSGISHLFEHVVTGDASQRRSERELTDLADSIGGLVNAYTAHDHICFHATTAVDDFPTALELLADWIVYPAFTPEVFRRELGVVQRELERDRDEPETQLEEILHAALYRGHPMAYPVIGFRESLLTLTHDDIVAYHHRFHSADRTTLVVAGDIEINDAVKAVAAAFRDLPRRPTSPTISPEPTRVSSPLRAIKYMQTPSAAMTLAWMTVRETMPDDVPLDLLSTVLADGDSARLVERLRWVDGLVYDVAGTHESTWHTPGTFQISAQLDAEDLDGAEAAILDAVAGLEGAPITSEELARAQRQSATSILMQRQTADGWAAQIGEDFLATRSPSYSDDYVRGIECVRLSDLSRVAKKYLLPGQRVLASVLPKRASKGKRKPQRTGRAAKTETTCLSNGAKLLIRPMGGAPFAGIYVCAGGGLSSEDARTNGLHNLMIESMLRGTSKRSGTELAELFAARGATLRVGGGLDVSGFDCVMPAAEFETLAEGFAEFVLSPAFAAEEIDKVKPGICDAIVRIDDDWHTELVQFARSRFFSVSPYRFIRAGSCENIQAFTPEQLRTLHAEVMQAGNVTIAVAGDVAPDAAAALCEELFGAMPNGRPVVPQDVAEDMPARDRLFIKRAAADREVAAMFVGYPSRRILDCEHRAGITLLATMLVGYSLSSGRLYNALRGGDSDMVYEVNSTSAVGLLPGYAGIVVACEPVRVTEAYEIIHSHIVAICAGDFDDAEVARAKAMIVAGELDQLQTPADYARRQGFDERIGLGLEDHARFLTDIREAGRECILRAGEAYLRHATIDVVTPRPESVSLGIAPDEIVE